MNGGWSEFGPYSSCRRTCDGGVRYRERECNKFQIISHAHVLMTQYLQSVAKILYIYSNMFSIYFVCSPEFGDTFCLGSIRKCDLQLCNTDVSTLSDY